MIKRRVGFSDVSMVEYCKILESVQLDYIAKDFVSSKKNNAKIEHKRDRSSDALILETIRNSIVYYSNAKTAEKQP